MHAHADAHCVGREYHRVGWHVRGLRIQVRAVELPLIKTTFTQRASLAYREWPLNVRLGTPIALIFVASLNVVVTCRSTMETQE